MSLQEFLSFKILEIGKFDLTVSQLLVFFAFLVCVIIFLKFIRKMIYRSKRFDVAKKYAIYSLIKYVIVVISVVYALRIFGLDITLLFGAGAALLVGIGLGLKDLFSDFISGIIILIDSSIKVDDVIDVNGLVCRVQEINLRTTTVLTREQNYIILPNSDLTRHQLINWTHSAAASRFSIKVGVDYKSDIKLVMRLLKEAAEEQKDILREPAPSVRFQDYGESSLDFALMFWSEEVFRVENIKSEIRVRIFEKFTQNKINIPFPHRVIHINKDTDG